ncbi:hypothetical protein EDB86DRAFT_2232153 [Lactarius hatsudake]|nr:hypothetical protein EDB86DRAFT_2232153 [Lactarius hatsudake]
MMTSESGLMFSSVARLSSSVVMRHVPSAVSERVPVGNGKTQSIRTPRKFADEADVVLDLRSPAFLSNTTAETVNSTPPSSQSCSPHKSDQATPQNSKRSWSSASASSQSPQRRYSVRLPSITVNLTHQPCHHRSDPPGLQRATHARHKDAMMQDERAVATGLHLRAVRGYRRGRRCARGLMYPT